jgi:hypothetical protein
MVKVGCEGKAEMRIESDVHKPNVSIFVPFSPLPIPSVFAKDSLGQEFFSEKTHLHLVSQI